MLVVCDKVKAEFVIPLDENPRAPVSLIPYRAR